MYHVCLKFIFKEELVKKIINNIKFKIKSVAKVIFGNTFHFQLFFMKNLLYLFLVLVVINSCENKNDYDITTGKSYEKNKLSLEKTEQKSPTSFLFVDGERKRNILGQSIIKGQITNRAKIVTYKDIDVKFSFYSLTGALLEEDHEVLYETIVPGGTKKFKSKYFTPKGTDSVGFKIISAKF